LKAMADHNHDRIEAQLNSVPAQGVGALRLDPSFTLPDYYAPHDFHLVPGSFHSNHIYALMTDMPNGPRTLSKDDAWEGARRDVLAAVPPGDYRVMVDLATGLGRAAVVLAERYPSASVTAIDLSAPQLRYGHWFAERRGLAIDFVQEDIRRTSVATGSVDLVVMLAVQHEQPPAAMRAILAEVARMLRPGGVFVNIDIVPNRHMPPFMRYWFGRHVETGSEPYWLVAGDLDLPAEFAAAGLVAVTERGPSAPLGLTGPHYPWTTIGRKPPAP
ncbi:MAG: class I SAM-dependent methyltransferase, partial [Dehalococcoidia bacterium]|nr:class I SAM-dependent methyltransferase [Dehalococcoidia bacterium]